MILVSTIDVALLERLATAYGLQFECVDDNVAIPGSFWGDPEAGLIGSTVYVRGDTPVHSFLHELCHAICMGAERREYLHTDAGGDDLEEAAVCFLQITLADRLPDVGRHRLMRDMDAWGYSFRLGSTSAWFESDSDDARNWLESRNLLSQSMTSGQSEDASARK